MSGWRGTALAAVVAATLAAAATWLVAWVPEATAETDPDTAQYPLQAVSFADPQSVTLILHPGNQRTVTSPVSGTITRDRCTGIESLSTGTVIAEVDQRPVIVMRTKAPLFRDLGGGETGADVAAVQSELRALGYHTPSTRRYDRQTKAAVQAFLHDRGLRAPRAQQGVLPLRSIVWVPPEDAEIEECLMSLGDRIGAGDPLLRLASDPGTIEYRSDATVVSGERVLVLGDARVPVSGSPIDDPTVVRTILATREGAAASGREEKALGAILELAEPIDAYPVPPSALFGINGAHACVSESGTPYPVTILASSLGLSYVFIDRSAPSAIDVFPARETPCG